MQLINFNSFIMFALLYFFLVNRLFAFVLKIIISTRKWNSIQRVDCKELFCKTNIKILKLIKILFRQIK